MKKKKQDFLDGWLRYGFGVLMGIVITKLAGWESAMIGGIVLFVIIVLIIVFKGITMENRK